MKSYVRWALTLGVAAVCTFTTTSAKQSAFACGVPFQRTIDYFGHQTHCEYIAGHWTCTDDYPQIGSETYYCDDSYDSWGDVNPADAVYTTETDTHCPPCHPGN